MKYYAQFYRRVSDTAKTEMLGSDSVFILDGRNRLPTMIKDAEKRMFQMRNIHRSIIGFTIKKGNRFESSLILYDSRPELKIEQ